MTTVHAAVKFASLTGLPKDATQVGFTFWNATDTAAALVGVCHPLIVDFFNTAVSGLGSLTGNFFGKQISRTGASAVNTWYDLTQLSAPAGRLVNPHLGGPIAQTTWSPSAFAGTAIPLPSEVACCLSYHGSTTGLAEDEPHDPTGPRGDIHPRARHRGRIYLGPLNGNCVSDPGTGVPVVSTDFRDLVTQQAAILMASGAWSVWSRKNLETYAVIGGFADTAFDTQRRRGEAPTGRTTFGSA